MCTRKEAFQRGLLRRTYSQRSVILAKASGECVYSGHFPPSRSRRTLPSLRKILSVIEQFSLRVGTSPLTGGRKALLLISKFVTPLSQMVLSWLGPSAPARHAATGKAGLPLAFAQGAACCCGYRRMTDFLTSYSMAFAEVSINRHGFLRKPSSRGGD